MPNSRRLDIANECLPEFDAQRPTIFPVLSMRSPARRSLAQDGTDMEELIKRTLEEVSQLVLPPAQTSTSMNTPVGVISMGTCWIAAEHALRHIERYCPQIEAIFKHYNIGRSQYAVCAGFDESCIRRGSSYLEQIHIFTLSTILATSPLLAELGKILSPFSSILFTESSRFSLPVYKDDGTIWEFDELVFKTASKCLDHGLTAAMHPAVISLSETAINKADESQQESGDGNGENVNKKNSGGSEEKGKGQNRDDGNKGKNPGDPSKDGNHGSGHPDNSGNRDIDGGPDDPDPPNDPDPEGKTKETTNSPNIAFEVVSNIYTNGNLSQIFQQINTAGELTIQVCLYTLTIFKIWT